jgi:rhodanese-related sulfurtransferase
MQHLTTPELAIWLENTARVNPILLDVREQWEFQTCKIDGSLIYDADLLAVTFV